MHTDNDTQTVTNTLALYGVHRPAYYHVRAVVRLIAYMAIIAAAILIPHAIVNTVMPYTDAELRVSLSTPCATEDSINCYWDATMGNGEGESYIDVDGRTYAW